MMEKDENIRDFFQSEKKEIKDNGFSKRVMRHLPSDQYKLANAWIAFCIAVGSILFFSFDGFKALCNILREIILIFLQNEVVHTHPVLMGILLVLTLIYGIRRVCTI